ncbi:hypothetical protein EOD42_10080 [Rhodovarius crocodyli]|uniref:Polysaccharide chain length determinant N-terminal domain-containing protein n=1 Tax=Rhodovarius crocodyli TaxID=1979269 RepID=A0A437MGH9_9PROT|nr:hypothetical protein [Rhodovarius crocodyli]RVT96751.1 hypothetical protein EOD42_10080 [Rhodovarius crocodyli]
MPSPADPPDTAVKPGFGMRLRRRLIMGGARGGRWRRYVLTMVIGLSVIWGMSIAYLVLAPRSYAGGFVFVLPGTGAGTSVNLESIGQAVSTSASAFSSPDFSPTQNYRRMLLSRRVLLETAQRLGIPESAFPQPRVDLADQAKLITVTVRGPTPAIAEERAQALHDTFLAVLDDLRRREIETRDVSYREMLTGYQARLDAARQRLVMHQAETGLVSLDQYGTIVASVERLREQQRDVTARLAQSRAGTERLVTLLGAGPETASAALMLRADPISQELLGLLARQEAELSTLTGTRGQANPRVADLSAERASTIRRLADRVQEITGQRPANVLRLRDLSLREERARLFERMVSAMADETALEGMQAEIARQIAAEQARSVSLAGQASRLDELRREMQVAEAVFSSALARIDTSKSDIFASYPMLQTLEAPSRPERPVSPLPILAVAGGMGATFFLFFALGLTWLRAALLHRILRSGSSSQPSPAPGDGTSSAPSISSVPQRRPA